MNTTAPTVLHVFTAINAVQSALAKEGITKSRKNQQQGYAFRGIDEIYNALSALLAEHSLVILPTFVERLVTERETKAGGALFGVTVKGEFTMVSSKDGSSTKVTTYGEAMDSADKATNKAMSAAYKYACLQAFCIPTTGDNDADAHTHEVAARRNAPAASRSAEPLGEPINWRDYVIHFGKNKGTPLGKLEANSLQWYVEKWQPKGLNGAAPSDEDMALRSALDRAGNDLFGARAETPAKTPAAKPAAPKPVPAGAAGDDDEVPF